MQMSPLRQTILRTILILAVAGFALLGPTGPGESPPKSPSRAAAERAWLLAKVGEWEFTSESHAGLGAEPGRGRGRTRVEAARWGGLVIERVEGELMGLEYEGMFLSGHDEVLDRHHSTWIDSLGTGVTTLRGTREGSTLTLSGTMTDPILGREVPYRLVEHRLSQDHLVLSMYSVDRDGAEFLSMRVDARRIGTPSAGR
jgi:hypothetical protein